jgi:hypothetical protein
MRATCWSALFHHGVGGAVEKRVVGLPGLLTSTLFFVKHRLCDHAFAVTFFMLSPYPPLFRMINQPLLIAIYSRIHAPLNYGLSSIFAIYVALPIVVINYVQP